MRPLDDTPGVRRRGTALVAVAVAAAVFLVGYDGGSFETADWARIGLAAWWAVALVVALGLGPPEPLPWTAWLAGAALAGLAALSLGSAAWAEAPGRAVTEFQRTLTYLGVFALVLVLARRWAAARWSDGIALGIVAVAATGLVSRFFPGTFSAQGIPELLPAAETRLSFPLGYWNGLALLTALAVPLLLRAAVAGASPLSRGAAVAPFPAVAAVLFLTSSRGGVAVAGVGAAAMLALAGRRWAVAGACAVGLVAAAGALAVLVALDDLVERPFTGPDAGREGVIAAVAVPLLGVIAGAAWGAISQAAPARSPLPRRVGEVVAALAVAGVVVAVVAADPRERFETFRAVPDLTRGGAEFHRSHLISAGGSGRWQFWTSAVDAFETEPLRGRGAGSYEAWWAQHGTLPLPARNAHSHYLETAADLGLLGVGLLALLVLAALLAPLRVRDRETAAALAAAFAGFAVALGIDWVWQLPAVAAVGIALLALLTGPAAEPRGAPADYRPPAALQSVLAPVAVIAALALLVPLLAETELGRSREAAARDDAQAAAGHARQAGEIEPWSPEPALQLALVQEQSGTPRAARRSLAAALRRDPTDWRLWLVDARLRTRLGDVAGARRSLARARSLNPRSPLWP